MQRCVDSCFRYVLVPTDPGDLGKGYTHKLTPDRALYEIEYAIKGLMLAVQRKMDLTFSAHLVKNIARLEIEKEILDIEETSDTFGPQDFFHLADRKVCKISCGPPKVLIFST